MIIYGVKTICASVLQAIHYLFTICTMASSPSPPTSSDTEGSIEVNPPHPQPRDNPSKINQLTKSRSMIARFNGSSTRRHAELDDEEGKAQFFLSLLFARYVVVVVI